MTPCILKNNSPEKVWARIAPGEIEKLCNNSVVRSLLICIPIAYRANHVFRKWYSNFAIFIY